MRHTNYTPLEKYEINVVAHLIHWYGIDLVSRRTYKKFVRLAFRAGKPWEEVVSIIARTEKGEARYADR